MGDLAAALNAALEDEARLDRDTVSAGVIADELAAIMRTDEDPRAQKTHEEGQRG